MTCRQDYVEWAVPTRIYGNTGARFICSQLNVYCNTRWKAGTEWITGNFILGNVAGAEGEMAQATIVSLLQAGK